MRRVLGAREMWSIVLFFAAVLVSAALVFTVFQPIATELGAPVWSLGAIAATMTISSAFGGWMSAATERRLGLPRTLAVAGVAVPLALLAGAAGARALFPLILLSPLAWNVLHPLVADYLARRTPDRERATVLSLNSMASQLATVMATPAVGLLVDGRGTGTALLASAAALSLVLAGAYALWRARGELRLPPTRPPEEGGSPASPPSGREA
ncbi:MAG: MFS transporter [Chloroflexi bacterium]|nr:MFS transporter [Chloroflexota bacterium]